MLNETQVQRFIEAADEMGCGISESSVAGTQDTVEDFVKQWGAPDEQETVNGITMRKWEDIQRRKGEPRGTLLVADFGEARAAYFG